MMNLNNLTPAKGSTKKPKKRIGRGQGSGKGGTATRGHKGAQSRSGYSRKPGFEGGQMPIQRRLPKRGFTSPNKTTYYAINLERLQSMVEKSGNSSFDVQELIDNKQLSKSTLVKILGSGKLESKMTVRAHAFSASAKEAIENMGGTVEIID